MDAETATLYATATIGKDAEEFIMSELGQVIINMAKQQSAEAMKKLKSVDASDAKAVQNLQNNIWKADSFEFWLGDLITAGKQAIQQLEERENG